MYNAGWTAKFVSYVITPVGSTIPTTEQDSGIGIVAQANRYPLASLSDLYINPSFITRYIPG